MNVIIVSSSKDLFLYSLIWKFDCFISCAGRDPETSNLNLPGAGVKVASDGKIASQAGEQSSVPHIYAIGDILQVRLSNKLI